MLLNYSMAQLEAIKHEHDGIDEVCWCYLMEKWLLAKGSLSYPASWEGLYNLLNECEAPDTARLLKTAIIQAIPLTNADGSFSKVGKLVAIFKVNDAH